jgi:pimeloyl-ACP methyl ester carboxylesterase
VRAPTRRPPLRAPIALAVVGLALATAACSGTSAERETRQHALADSTAVSFTTSGGVRLAGRLFGPRSADAGVVLAHMLPADQSSWYDFADRLGALGYRVLTFDFRGYCPGGDAGCSAGTKQPSAAADDLDAALTYLQGQGVLRSGLVGASMGGTASLVVASQQPRGVDTVITVSAPQSIDGLTAGNDVLQLVTAPKLYIAGQLDTVAAGSAQAFYDNSLQPKRLDLFTTSDHGTDMLTGNQAEPVRNAILGWLAQYLPVDQPSGSP